MNGTWSFGAGGYDSLNRLVSGSATAGPYQGLQMSWSYDSFGNRKSESFGGSTGESLPPSTAAQYNANNQVTGGSLGYNAAGNVTADNANYYLYDGEGRVCAVQDRTFGGMTEYIYNAEGTRVAKGTIYAWTCDITSNGFTLTNTYVIGPSGEQLTETDGSGNWLHTNVYAAGQLLATYSYTDNSHAATDTYFALSDWLGTKRAVVSAGGCGTGYISLPYGDSLTATSLPGFTQCPDATEHHFTGKERDAESGLDNFGARYMASTMGRFMSPDPINLTEERLLNPSNTLNKYAYAANNPLKYVDDDGKDITIFYERPSLFPPSAGHILMTAENQQTGAAAVMSFGPIREGIGDTERTLAGMSQVSTSEFGLAGATADSLRQQYASLTIQTTPEEAQQVIDWIGQHGGVEALAGGYMLYDQNCTTVCRDALKMVNKIAQGNQDWSPSGFWKTAFSQYAHPYFQNTFGWTGSQPGVNYGQPRGGYDSFRLLELLSKQCTDSWDDKSNTLTSSCH